MCTNDGHQKKKNNASLRTHRGSVCAGQVTVQRGVLAGSVAELAEPLRACVGVATVGQVCCLYYTLDGCDVHCGETRACRVIPPVGMFEWGYEAFAILALFLFC